MTMATAAWTMCTALPTTIWQRKNLVLVTLPDFDSPSAAYAGRLVAQVRGVEEDDTEWVVTRDRIPAVSCPGVVVADQWGEIAFVADAPRAEELPMPDELLEWVAHLRHRCPECEGEAR